MSLITQASLPAFIIIQFSRHLLLELSAAVCVVSVVRLFTQKIILSGLRINRMRKRENAENPNPSDPKHQTLT